MQGRNNLPETDEKVVWNRRHYLGSDGFVANGRLELRKLVFS